MAKDKIKLVVKTPSKTLVNAITSASAKKLNSALAKASGPMSEEIKQTVRDALMVSPTVESIRSGRLRYELGFPEGTEDITIDSIIDAISQSVHVRFKGVKSHASKISTDMQIIIQGEGVKSLLGLPEASIITKKKTRLYWLGRLLISGDSIIVDQYRVETLSFDPDKSRSGDAVMRFGGVGFKISPEHSGTPEDNFITRALRTRRASQKITSIIIKHFKANLK